MPDTPQTFGHWHLASETNRLVVIRCDCGRTRTMPRSTWVAGKHISQQCKACLVRDAEDVHAWLFNKKSRLKHG